MRAHRLLLAATLIALIAWAAPTLAATGTFSPSLRAQAHRLYAPAGRYERSLTPAHRRSIRRAGMRLGQRLDACDARYRHRLTEPTSRRGEKLYGLWNYASLLQTYRVEVRPVAGQLRRLADAWAALSLRKRALNEFVHAMATELRATLDSKPLNTCVFVRRIAAHHFSYAWAQRSSWGVRAAHWWKQISRAGNRTGSFWRYVFASPGEQPPPGAGLFTRRQLGVLGNLPGELG